MRTYVAGGVAAVLLAAPTVARAQEPTNPDTEIGDKHDAQQKRDDLGASAPARPEVDAASEAPRKEDEGDPDHKFTVSGYIESFYQWNFNVPGNGISAYRGYDNRHNTFTLQNAVIDVGFRAKDVLARVALQVGHAPAVIYQDEPDKAATESANASNGELWRYLQRASFGWQANSVVLIEAGLFPSVTGVESTAVKENWNWSRSNASVRLPNYHAGVRGTFDLNKRVDAFVAVTNGWNNVVDNNDEKSFIAGVHYKYEKKLTLSGSYFGGIERDAGAAEGRAWRHGIETWAQWDATEALSVAADGSSGFERTRFGTAWWASAAAYVRVKLVEWLSVAARADRTWEDTASSALGTSDPILYPAKHVTSGTGTVDFHPVKGFSTRLEYRHDESNAPLYYRAETTARYQNTLLLGATAWF